MMAWLYNEIWAGDEVIWQRYSEVLSYLRHYDVHGGRYLWYYDVDGGIPWQLSNEVLSWLPLSNEGIALQRYNERLSWLRYNEIRAWSYIRAGDEGIAMPRYNDMRARYNEIIPRARRKPYMRMMYRLYNKINAGNVEMRARLNNEILNNKIRVDDGGISWQQYNDVLSWLRLSNEGIEEFTDYEDLADDPDVTRWSNEISMPYNGIEMPAARVLYTKHTIDVLLSYYKLLSYYVGIHGIIFAAILSVPFPLLTAIVSAFILTRVLYPKHIIYKLLSDYVGIHGMIFPAIFSLLIISMKMHRAMWWTFPILTAMISAIVINLFRHRTAFTDVQHHIRLLNRSCMGLDQSHEGISLRRTHRKFHLFLLGSSARAIIRGNSILNIGMQLGNILRIAGLVLLTVISLIILYFCIYLIS